MQTKPHPIKIDRETKDLEFIANHSRLAITSCFYGEIRIKFEAGKVVKLNKDQSFKP